MTAKNKPPSKDYEVGYGKPPKDGQFTRETAKRGGRPLGSKNKPKPGDLTPSERMALIESRRIVQADTKLTAGTAVERAQIKTAVTGGTMAQKAYLARVSQLEQKERDAEDERLNRMEEYVRYCEDLLDRATPEQRGLLKKGMLPHPADVEVDFGKREVRILGPATSFERREYAAVQAELATLFDAILRLRVEIEQNQKDWALQAYYIEVVGGYADIAALFPDRHKPPKITPWAAAQSFPWWWEPSSGFEYPAVTSQPSKRRSRSALT